MPRERVAALLAVVMCAGLAILGWQAAANLSNIGIKPAGVETITNHAVRTETRTIHSFIHGRVVTLPGGTRVVHVPLLVIHTDTRVIRIPPHNIPLRNASVAEPTHTVTITIPVTVTQTVQLPPVTTTETRTQTETVTSTITIPLSLPSPSHTR
jgi:hypothetical protein